MAFLKQVPITYLCLPPLIKKDYERFKALVERSGAAQITVFAMAIRLLSTATDEDLTSWVTKLEEDYPKRRQDGARTR